MYSIYDIATYSVHILRLVIVLVISFSVICWAMFGIFSEASCVNDTNHYPSRNFAYGIYRKCLRGCVIYETKVDWPLDVAINFRYRSKGCATPICKKKLDSIFGKAARVKGTRVSSARRSVYV